MSAVVRTKSIKELSAHPGAAARTVKSLSLADAAAAAEFAEKKRVWVPDEAEGYVSGWVVREDCEDGKWEVRTGEQTRFVNPDDLSKQNPPRFDSVQDIAELTFLNEASVVHNLRTRYGANLIYTYSGLFLVAVNPYRDLPIYTDAMVAAYRNRRREDNAPHIFAVADRAWNDMIAERENQSVLITGESGAGKTENTKKVIQYLAAIASESHSPSYDPTSIAHTRSPSRPTSSFRRQPSSFAPPLPFPASASSTGALGSLEAQILQANPILEAFGNAQTVRNNNSSRFGKFVRIEFASGGAIAGAHIDWYLLEKSRVTNRAKDERSFHVFYQMLAAAPEDMRGALLLEGGIDDYEYLKHTRREVDGINDRDEWAHLKTALDVVGFTPDEQLDLFRIVASILHIGNITLHSSRSTDQASLSSPHALQRVAQVLGLPPKDFTTALLSPRVKAGREWVSQARTARQVADEMAALARTLYEKSFGALVERINRALGEMEGRRAGATFIGVLDIAGFEIFQRNSFEQLCINYTNERLQQFFNHHMFVLEQEEYAREGIQWDFVNFGLDLQPTINLIESTDPIGILSCLDEECIMPKATDVTFTEKLHGLWAGGATKDMKASRMAHDQPPSEDALAAAGKYAPAKYAPDGFVIQHYAGKVEYRTEGWLEKNKDPLNDHLTRTLAASSDKYVASLFSDYADEDAGAGAKRRAVKKGAFRTVGQRHKEQLTSLMAQLGSTQPHFVRCIVPNSLKKPGKIDTPLVLDQLRCNGVLEGIRIARLGYPNRLPFAEFRNRYEVLTPGVIPRGYMDARKACQRMLDALALDGASFKIGTSKIFFKAGVLAEMEERRDQHLFDIFSQVQAAARRYVARRQIKKILNRATAARTIQRNARIYIELREWPWWNLYTRVRPLLAATRSDQELKQKQAHIKSLEDELSTVAQDLDAASSENNKLLRQIEAVEKDLESERHLSLSNQELLARSKAQEAELLEERAALQAEIDTLESQLERSLASMKSTEAKYAELKDAFDVASEHLVRLEAAEKEWKEREIVLADTAGVKQDEWDAIVHEKEALGANVEELKAAVRSKEEDLERSTKRLQATTAELEARLDAAVKEGETHKAKVESATREARQHKDRVSELARTAADFQALIAKREDDVASVAGQLKSAKSERDKLAREGADLHARISTLSSQLEAQKLDRDQIAEVKAKREAELDELRQLLDEKVSEETRQKEVEQSKAAELADLRAQLDQLRAQHIDDARVASEHAAKLQADLEEERRKHGSLSRSHASLSTRAETESARLKEAESKADKIAQEKRAVNAELQNIRARHLESDAALTEARASKDALSNQLAEATRKHHDLEDAILQLERERDSYMRQRDQLRAQADSIVAELKADEQKRAARHAADEQARLGEINQLKEHVAAQDKALAKMRADLAGKDDEIRFIKARGSKTVVEHIHVLEEAKRVTDRQLAEARSEVSRMATYIKSLEKGRSRLTGEQEDLMREMERRRIAAEKDAKAHAQKTSTVVAEARKERLARETAEATARRLEKEVTDTRDRLADATKQISNIQRSKSNLEAELASFANESKSQASLKQIHQDSDSRLKQMEARLQESEAARASLERAARNYQKQTSDVQRLLADKAPIDDTLRAQILRDLADTSAAIQREMTAREDALRSHKPEKPLHVFGNMAPSKRNRTISAPNGNDVHGAGLRARDDRSDNQSQLLRGQLDILELQVAASDRVRQHLEDQVREMTHDLEASDGTAQSLEATRARLAKQNARLAELLDAEADARRQAEGARLDGTKEMWDSFRTQLSAERGDYSRLEESRKALLAQQRVAQTVLEERKVELADISRARDALSKNVSHLEARLEQEILSKNEQIVENSRLQEQLQEFEEALSAAQARENEIMQELEGRRKDVGSTNGRLEAAEVARIRAEKAEAFARTSLADTERLMSDALVERKDADDRLVTAQQQLRDLQAQYEDDIRELSDAASIRKRLQDELDAEQKRHERDLADRDHAIEQTRRKYQAELARLADEVQAQRGETSKYREEARRYRGERDELQLQFDNEGHGSSAWQKERERLDFKIRDLTSAYDAAMAAQNDGQDRVVKLLSEVRGLRATLDETQSERDALKASKAALDRRLEDIGKENLTVSQGKLSSDRVLQALDQEKQNLRAALQERTDQLTLAMERQRKADAYAIEAQSELTTVRREATELDQLNVALNKQVKDLQIRITDLETKSYSTNSPRPPSKTPDSRVKEQLAQLTKEKESALRAVERTRGEYETRLQEQARATARLEEDLAHYNAKIGAMRSEMEQLRTSESTLQLERRRYERELAMHKEDNLRLQRDIDVLKSRVQRAPTLSGNLDRDAARAASVRQSWGHPPPPSTITTSTAAKRASARFDSNGTPQSPGRFSFDAARAAFGKPT